MDDKRLDDQLKLLKKSYDRMPKHLDVDALMDKIDEEEKTAVIQKPKRNMTRWIAAATALVACGMLIQSTFTEEAVPIEMDPRLHNERAVFTTGEQTTAELLQTETSILRSNAQAALALPDEQFNALSFVQEADSRASFYVQTPAAYEADVQRASSLLSFAYATPSQRIQQFSSSYMSRAEVMYDFLVHVKDVKAAYGEAYNEADEELRGDIAQAAKAEGIYFVDGAAVFRYDKFVDFYGSDLESYGFIRGLVVMAQFDDTLYEVDDLRYAPDDMFPYFKELTMALLTVDYMPLKDKYESQFVLMVLRMLQGTEKYPLTESSIAEFLAHDAGVFTPIAETISAELQQSGTSRTAEALTYDELLDVFTAARIPINVSISGQDYWEPTTDELARIEAWQTMPDDLLQFSGKDTVLYYLRSAQRGNDNIVAVFDRERSFSTELPSMADVASIQFTLYGDEAVDAHVTLQTNKTMTLTFMRVDDAWQRIQ